MFFKIAQAGGEPGFVFYFLSLKQCLRQLGYCTRLRVEILYIVCFFFAYFFNTSLRLRTHQNVANPFAF